MTNTITKERRDAIRVLIREALRFAYWAAGEGACPAEGQPAISPDDFLMAYSNAKGDLDWDTLPDRLPALLDATEAMTSELAACGGCGTSDPKSRCIGCLHDFGTVPPAAEPVKVKPLVWEKGLLGGWQAQTFYGRYSVGKNPWNSNGFEMRDPDCGDSDTLASGEYETEQAAMDAAQAIHEENIRSALVSEKEAE